MYSAIATNNISIKEACFSLNYCINVPGKKGRCFAVRKNKVLTVIAMILALIQVFAVITFATSSSQESGGFKPPFVPVYTEGTYGEYLQNHSRDAIPNQKVDLDISSDEILRYINGDESVTKDSLVSKVTNGQVAASLVDFENVTVETVNGRQNVLVTQEDSYIEFSVVVPVTGMYSVGVDYCPIMGSGSTIEREITINGEYPFLEAHSIGLDRIYQDEVDDVYDSSTFIKEDSSGNQVRKPQIESPRWIDGVGFRDSSNAYNGSLKFYLERGKVITIRISSIRGASGFSGIYLYGEQDSPSYSDFYNENLFYDNGGNKEIAKIEAEYPIAKNDPMLFASYDRASSATSPSSSSAIKLNTLGGSTSGYPTWCIAGQWVEYYVDVETTGLYKLALRARQSGLNGCYTTREIWVNGEVQFEEAANIKFRYDGDWQMIIPTDEDTGETLLFKLEKGRNTIRLKAVTGDMSGLLNGVEAVINKLNTDYRKTIMITSTSPDPYRDYDLENEIPETISDLKAQADILKSIYDEFVEQVGTTGQYSAVLQNVYNQLYNLYETPSKLEQSVSSLQGYVTNLSEWLVTVQEQPLEIDYILVTEPDYEVPKPNAGFFSEAWFQTKMFFSSFFTDFNSISSDEEFQFDSTVKAWTMTARDQAQVMRNIIDRSFIQEHQVNLDLDLVVSGALLPSILAGNGPDVAHGISSTDLINFASRNVLQPLDDFEGFEEVTTRFSQASFKTTSLRRYVLDEDGNEVTDENGNKRTALYHYGLPESQSITVLASRTDILEELGKSAPETWDEIYELLPILQKRYMEFSPPDFNTLFYQRGGTKYVGETREESVGIKTALDTELAIETFIDFTDFYTLYKLPISFDFQNRFRNGEMPLGCVDLYGFYNVMSVFAPEIKGLWEFTLVPGTVREDENGEEYVDHTIVNQASSCIMLAGSKNKADAWRYMTWWTGTQAQTDFSREIESILGAAGRNATANIEAIKNLYWTKAELNVILEQMSWLVGHPEVPGGYILDRQFSFANTNVIVEYTDPRETLLDNIKPINEELIRKRTELNLPMEYSAD